MKKYLYILFSATLLTACEFGFNLGFDSGNDNGNDDGNVADVNFHFGSIDVITAMDSATIEALKPYMTVDSEEYDYATIYLEYAAFGDDDSATTVRKYSTSTTDDDYIIFTLNGLTPDTRYIAYLYIDGGSNYGNDSRSFSFTTKGEESATCEITCSSTVDAKALKATIKLSDVGYLVDGEHAGVNNIRLEYSLKNSKTWTIVDVDGSELNNRKVNITIPAEGGDYLKEESTYRYRVTITPADDSYEPLTTEVEEFITDIANVEVTITTPIITLDEETLHVEIASVDIYCDGIYYPTYPYVARYICLSKAGAESWDIRDAEATLNGMKLDIPLTEFTPGAVYGFAGAVVAGLNDEQYISEIATVIIPKEEEEEENPLPKPPVGGSSDTTVLAGTWHLTQWRGDEPSFDIYLTVSEDGVVGLWQRLEHREWELYYSTVIYEDNTLWGEYTDGTTWGASYYVDVESNTMTWTDTADATDISVYTRAELPDDIAVTSQATTRATSPRFL